MMKKLILSFFLILSLSPAIHGQWYYKKYGVTSISSLSVDQLNKASKETKTSIGVSCICIGVGGLVYLIEYLLPYDLESDENPTFLEQLMGEQAVHTSIQAVGIGIAAAGTIACLAYFGRYASINHALRRSNSIPASISLSPSVFPVYRSPSVCGGFSLTCRF